MNRNKLDQLCERLGEAQEQYRKECHRLIKEAIDARDKFLTVVYDVEQSLVEGGVVPELSAGTFELRFEDVGDMEEQAREAASEIGR